MLKTEIIKKEKEINFPALMQLKENKTIILLVTDISLSNNYWVGMILTGPNTGKYATNFLPSQFEPFEGELCLKNMF